MKDRCRNGLLGLMSVVMGAICMFLILDKPDLLPANDTVSYYMNNATKETTAVNVVTAIYLNYRVFDTVFEALLLLIAVTAILFIYPIKEMKKVKKTDVVLEPLRDLLVFILPFILLFGVALVLNGDKTPGGGFQGGAILVVVFVAGFLIDDSKTMNLKVFTIIEKFAFISLTVIITGFLCINFIEMPTIVKRSYLLTINTLIGMKVCAGLGLMFYRFSRIDKEEIE